MFKDYDVFSRVLDIKYIANNISVYMGFMQKEFVKEYVINYDNDFYEPLSGRVNLDSFSDKLHGLANTFVIVYNGEVAGLLASYFYDKESKKGFITLVHVKNQFRGLQLSTYLVQTAQEYAKSINFNCIDLLVYRNNVSAFGLYTKLGFKVINEENGRCAMRWVA